MVLKYCNLTLINISMKVGNFVQSIDYFTPWLDNLEFEWGILTELGEKQRYKKGELIFQEGDEISEILIVLVGRVRLFTNTIHGKEKTHLIIGKNGLLGEHFYSGYKKQILNGEAVSDLICRGIPLEKFIDNVENNYKLLNEVLSLSNLKMITIANSSNMDINHGTSLQKIVKILIYLNKVYGVTVGNGYSKISISFTQQEIADLVGVSRVTVSKSLSRLIKNRILYKEKSYYYLNELRMKEL